MTRALIAIRQDTHALKGRVKSDGPPVLLRELIDRYPRAAGRAASIRPALKAAAQGDMETVQRLRQAEQDWERKRDERYWKALRADLERWRQEGRVQKPW